MNNILNNFKQVWQQASGTHRFFLISIVAGFLLVVGLLFTFATSPEKSLLVAGLKPSNAAKVVEKLDEQGISYTLHETENGTSIYVGSIEQARKLRITSLSKVLPQQEDKGWAIMDRDSIGMSPFVERTNFTRALCGELAMTIKMIDGVKQARVQIVTPKTSVFSRNKQDAKASVYVKTDGRKLSKSNVRAISKLVAGAAKGVTPETVVVVVNGKLEAGMERDSTTSITGTLLETKVGIEKYLAEKAQKQLALVVGDGNCNVTVNATLSTSAIERTRKILDAEGRVESSITTKKKDLAAEAKTAGNTGDKTKEKTEEINYITPTTLEKQTDLPGKIEKVTASILIDLSNYNKEVKDESAKLTVEKVQQIVQQAIGLSSTKGIVVQDAVFSKPTIETEVEEESLISIESLGYYLKKASLGLAVLGAIIALIITTRNPAKKKALQEQKEKEKQLEEEKKKDVEENELAPALEVKQMHGPDRALRQQIVNTLVSEPDKVKQMFLSWVESSAS